MSDDQRVLCTDLGGIKRVQIHDLNKLYRYDAETGKFVPDTSQMADPKVAANIGDLIGYLNKQEAAQYPPNGGTGGGIVPVADIENVTWGDGRRILIDPWGCECVAALFVVPATPAVWQQAGRVSLANYDAGGTAFRQGSLSIIAGDFRDVDPTGANGPFALSPGVNSTLDFGVGYSGIPNLAPGKAYYVNWRNYDPAANNGAGQCTVPPGQSRPASYSFVWPGK